MISFKELQNENPLRLSRLPIPALEDTMNRYIASIQAIATPAEIADQHKLCEGFLSGTGAELQVQVGDQHPNSGFSQLMCLF